MPSDAEDSAFDYVLYVDEAGDDGIRSFRPEDPKGSSEWLCLAGYLVRRKTDPSLPEVLSELRATINATQGRSLHYRDLSRSKRLAACEFLGKRPARAFAICSYKRTMHNHRNPRAEAAAGSSRQFFYNWIARLLLERVTEFCLADCEKNGTVPTGIKIVFSHRGGHRYGQMKAYFALLKRQALTGSTFLAKRIIRPELFRWGLVDYVPHYQLAGLQLADVVASAVYQGLDTHSAAWSCDPVRALRPIFAQEPCSPPSFADFGMTLIPRAAPLDEQQRTIFQEFGYRFKKPRA